MSLKLLNEIELLKERIKKLESEIKNMQKEPELKRGPGRPKKEVA